MKKKLSFLVSLGKRLRELRRARKLTQVDLGQRADLSGKYIGEVEGGHRDLRVTTIQRLAKGLGVGVEDVFHFRPEDQTIAEIERRLHGRDPALRAHVVRLVNEMLMVADTAK